MIQDASPLAAAPKKARIEIIPLIDVIFFLLATFVLFTLSLDKIKGFDVPLPKAPGRESSDIDTTLYLQASDGVIHWKEGKTGVSEPVTLVELAPRLADYTRRVAEPRVFVRGDSTAKFGVAVLILDEVRAAGIRQASVETLVSKTGS